MSDVLTVAGFVVAGVVLAAMAWRRLEREEHDVLHTHPKLVVVLIIAGTLILGVQAVGVRYGARALHLVESAVDPEGEAARRGAQQQIVVVADIEDVSIAAAACAQSNMGIDAIESCVIEQVETRHGAPPIVVARTTTTEPGG